MTVIPFPCQKECAAEEARATYVRLAKKANETMLFEDGWYTSTTGPAPV